VADIDFTATAQPQTIPGQSAKELTGIKDRPRDEEIGQSFAAQIGLADEERQRLSDWLVNELQRATDDRGDFTDELAEWERLYEARPKVANKTIPWDGASNLVVPVIATAVDSVLARLMNSIFATGELWATKQRSAKWAGLTDPIQAWLNWVQSEVLKMYHVCQRWFLSTIKSGTGVGKLTWERRMRKIVYSDGIGSATEEIVTLHDGPVFESVSLDDFFTSSDALYSHDVQTCEWVAQRGRLTYKQLKEKEASGIFYDVDKILSYQRTQSSDVVEDETAENVRITPSEYNDWEIWEVWCSYVLDAPEMSQQGETSTGVYPAELIVHIEPNSGHILSVTYNYYRHQERPFHVIRWMPRERSFFGIGLCKMLADIQEEITTIHNQRLDNASIANMKVFKRRTSVRIGPLDIYPGAQIPVEEMDDIDSFDLGTEHSTLLQEELHTNSIGEKRSAVNDYTVGRESSAIGSRATATSTLALIRESNKRFAMTINDIRERLSDIGHQVTMLYQQFAPDKEVMYEMFDEEEAALMQQWFTLPVEYTKTNIYIDTPAISEMNNKEMQQQILFTLLQVVEKFYMGIGNAMMVVANPQAPMPVKEVAKQAVISSSRIFQKILEAFDFRDAKSYAPDINQLLALMSGMEMMGGMGGQATGPETQPGGGAPTGGAQAQAQQSAMGGVGGQTQQRPGGRPQGSNGAGQRGGPGQVSGGAFGP